MSPRIPLLVKLSGFIGGLFIVKDWLWIVIDTINQLQKYLCWEDSNDVELMVLFAVFFCLQLVISVYQGGYNFFCQNTHSGGEADNRVKQQNFNNKALFLHY